MHAIYTPTTLPGPTYAPVRSADTRSWAGSLLLFPLCVLYLLNQGELAVFDAGVVMAHDIGHHMFDRFGGWFVHASGLLMQALLPMAVVAFSYLAGLGLCTQLSFFWLGQSFIHLSYNVSTAPSSYLSLYNDMQQDWSEVLGALGLFEYTSILGLVFFMAGILCFFACVAFPLAER